MTELSSVCASRRKVMLPARISDHAQAPRRPCASHKHRPSPAFMRAVTTRACIDCRARSSSLSCALNSTS
eukprot:3596235-Pleurochrysis_carterae.AAC.2